MAHTDDALFRPVVDEWQHVSPKLALVRRIVFAPTCAVLAIAAAVTALLLDEFAWIAWAVVAASIVVGVALWIWAGRNQRSWGYSENADNLVVTSGVMFKRLVMIPYGRMQFVDVKAGPVHRFFGIATVTLHTASTATAANIPGLLADEATRLRNRLTELGESHGAGI